jgi:hypothetical protein
MTSSCVYADNLFQTGWGSAFNNSAEGQLIFTLLELIGAYSCIKSFCLGYQYHKGTQTQYGGWKCVSIFIAGVLLFHARETANLIYNSF